MIILWSEIWNNKDKEHDTSPEMVVCGYKEKYGLGLCKANEKFECYIIGF